ncbi:PE-PGRS family protein [Streptomyces albidoflavus]
MRTVNPQDLEQLAKLLDGRGGLSDKLDEAFTRASNLGVSSKLSTLRPLRSWVTDTAPDLRKRATFARLEDGDPEAGLRWAGFTDKELAKLKKEGLSPDQILLANSVAASDDPNADKYKRQPNESLNDWITRLEAGAISKIPGLAPHEETIASLIKYAGDAGSIIKATGVITVQGAALTNVLAGNALKNGPLRTWKTRLGVTLRASNNGWVRQAGNWLVRSKLPIRSLSAPGAWLPSRLGALFQQSSLYQNLTRIPLTNGVRASWLGNGYNALRSSSLARSMRVNGAINFLVGHDGLAARYGGTTHSGQRVARAAQASLTTVGRNLFTARGGLANPGASLRFAAAGTAKAAGLIRGAGVVGGVISTGVSAANVISQGNPVDAFKRNGAGYVADVAEVGFNASLTAAMVAPNPVTIGAAVVTGAIYGGAKIVENWDDIKAGAGKAADWAKDKGGKVVDGAKNLAKKADPRNWF